MLAIIAVQKHSSGSCVLEGKEWEPFFKLEAAYVLERMRNEDGLRRKFIEFNHVYTLKVRDVKLVLQEMSAPEGWSEGDDVTMRKSIYDLVTPSDEALGFMFYMNMEELWAKQWSKRDDLDDTCHDARCGKWTKRGGRSFEPGFDDEALKYYANALQLFKAVRADKDLLFKFTCESVLWYDANVRGPRRKKAKRTRSTTASADSLEPAEAPLFEDLLEDDDEGDDMGQSVGGGEGLDEDEAGDGSLVDYPGTGSHQC